MKDFDKILDQLKDASGEMKDNMHMLNEIVPVDEQLKYFRYSTYIQKNKDGADLDRNYLISRLFTLDVDIEDKRYYLCVLAGIVDVAAFRAIETYYQSPLEEELKNWSALALVESKILLDADLSGKKQYFVSTGLGGVGKKMRFFVVIASATRKPFTDFQKALFLKELKFQLDQNEVDVESLDVRENYIKIFLLCGLNHNARILIDNAIKEANELGNFVDEHFLMTNLKQMEDVEIERFLSKSDQNKNT